jgi:hypothetical protein
MDISKQVNYDKFGWVIIGGESGSNPEYLYDPTANWHKMIYQPGRRTMKIEWAYSLMLKAKQSNLPVWFKQVTSARAGVGHDALGFTMQEVPPPPSGTWDEKAEESEPAVHVLSKELLEANEHAVIGEDAAQQLKPAALVPEEHVPESQPMLPVEHIPEVSADASRPESRPEPTNENTHNDVVGDEMRSESLAPTPNAPGGPFTAPKKYVPGWAFHGGKAKLAERIIRLFPPSGYRYVEPLCGRANVYFWVAQRLEYKKFWLNDINIGFVRALEYFSNVPPIFDQATYDKFKEAYKAGKHTVRLPVAVSSTGEVGAYIDCNIDLMAPAFVFSSGNWGAGGHKIREKVPDSFRYKLKYIVSNEIIRRTQPRITDWDYRRVLAECGAGDMVYL